MDQFFVDAHRRGAEADKELELRRQSRTCPKCGSDDRYTEMRIRSR